MTKLLEATKWYFVRDGIPENVQLERWVWKVIYRDGTELHQFDNEGIFHKIAEIQHHKAALFIIFKPENPDSKIEFIVPQGATLIHFYKNIVLNALTPWEKKHRIYVFGYELNGHSHYNFILPNDRILQSINAEIKLSEAL